MSKEINIPTYRAKKINSDEYAIGQLQVQPSNGGTYIYSLEEIGGFTPYIEEKFEQSDPSTLSIHFKNMIDANGKKIFASLSEDGKGGDILEDGYVLIYDGLEIKKRSGVVVCEGSGIIKGYKVTGIQK